MRNSVLSLAVFTMAAAAHAEPTHEDPSAPDPAPPAESRQDGTPPRIAAEPTPSEAQTPVLSKWSTALFGFAELDIIGDSTQSYNDVAGNTALKRPGTWGAEHGRVMMGVRNSRLGFKFASPSYHGVKASGVVEADFLGNQPSDVSEAGFWASPPFRIRQALGKLETSVVDLLAGQYWQLFGWEPLFFPNSVQIQPLPGQVSVRTPQLRVSKKLESHSLGLEAAMAASRPAQRDAAVPDGSAGLRVFWKQRKGVHTLGATGTAVDPLSIGVSGILRHFEVPDPAASGADVARRSQTATGWGISVDGLIPVIRATDDDHSNGLTLTGSYVRGAGIADLYSNLSGGMRALALPAGTTSVDVGLVGFDSSGRLRPIEWRSFIVGIQYYFPRGGNFWIAFNYSQIDSDNINELSRSPASVFNTSSPAGVFTRTRWADGNLFWSATPAMRFGFEYAWTQQTYADGGSAHNNRYQLSSFYLF